MSIFSVLANESFMNLSELILDHLSTQDLGAMRLTCKKLKIYIDSQKFWAVPLTDEERRHKKLKCALAKEYVLASSATKGSNKLGQVRIQSNIYNIHIWHKWRHLQGCPAKQLGPLGLAIFRKILELISD